MALLCDDAIELHVQYRAVTPSRMILFQQFLVGDEICVSRASLVLELSIQAVPTMYCVSCGNQLDLQGHCIYAKTIFAAQMTHLKPVVQSGNMTGFVAQLAATQIALHWGQFREKEQQLTCRCC